MGIRYSLDATKTVQSITLPATRNIVMLAMNLATPSIPGTFVYNPPAGTIEPVGTDTLSVTFTPTDTTDYKTATATVQLVVDTACHAHRHYDNRVANAGKHHLRHAVELGATRCRSYGHGATDPRDPHKSVAGTFDFYRRYPL